MSLLKGISLLVKEVVDFYRFFWRTSKEEKAILFYSEHEGYYPNFEGLIEKITGSYNRTICYVTSDLVDPILQVSKPMIQPFYQKKLLPLFMAAVNCKVFVMTLTDLHQLYLKRSRNPVHYVYVFHALVSTHMIYRYGAFDYYDSILCCGRHHTEEIRRHEKMNDLPEKSLIKAGYYRLERIHEAYQRYALEKPDTVTGITILVAPSWGDANIMESCGERLVEILLNAGYEVILRPHPETIRRSPDLIALFTTKFGGNKNFSLETSISGDASLLRADVLVSDYSGIALEYAFGTERPVLFIDAPLKIRNQRYNELAIEPLELSLRQEIGTIVSPEELESVSRVVEDMMLNRLAYKEKIIELRGSYVYAFGYSSDVGAEYIVKIANDMETREQMRS